MGGPSWGDDPRLEGFSIGARGRISALLHLLDVEVTGLHTGYLVSLPATGGGQEAGETEASLARWSLGLSLNMHPGMLLLLESNYLGYVLGGLYLAVGASLDWGKLDPEGKSQLGASYHWGGGLDLPLGDPDEGDPLWLTAVYRRSYLRLSELHPVEEMGGHVVMIGLGYRYYDLFR